MSAEVSSSSRIVSRSDYTKLLDDSTPPPQIDLSSHFKVMKAESLELLKIHPKLKCEISEGFLRETIEMIENNLSVISQLHNSGGRLINRNHRNKIHRTLIIDKTNHIYISCKKHSHFAKGIGRGVIKKNTFLVDITAGKIMVLGSSSMQPTEHVDYQSGQISYTYEHKLNADREALAAELFKDAPNVIQYHDVFNYVGGGLFPEPKQAIIMDYYPEGDLVGFTNDYLTGKLMFTSEQMYRFIRSLCNGLAVLHEKGYIHRDVKPDNYLVKKIEENGVIYYEADLTDFGFLVHQNDKAKLNDAVGTVSYVAPEFWEYFDESHDVIYGYSLERIKCKHFDRITTAADVYALGVYLCQLFLNHQPPRRGIESYRGDPWLRALKEPVGKPLEHLLWRMTRKNPKERPTIVEVLERLMPALEHFYATKP